MNNSGGFSEGVELFALRQVNLPLPLASGTWAEHLGSREFKLTGLQKKKNLLEEIGEWSVFILTQYLTRSHNRDTPFFTRSVSKFRLHFRKQDGRSSNASETANEIQPGIGEFTASLYRIIPRALDDRRHSV